MTSEERCAQIFHELRSLGMACLVMGGHAVRFYGIQRGTVDYDLAISSKAWDGIGSRLARSTLFGGVLREGESWRPHDFRRFIVGSLEDGREERLEFWCRNHLLPTWEDLFTRRRTGPYGGHPLDFLGLDDLLRSKETEREEDWRDILLLEEIADEERLGTAVQHGWLAVLCALRSQRGFASVLRRGGLECGDDVALAIERARHPVTVAFLLPFAPSVQPLSGWPTSVAQATEILERHIRRVEPASARHLALVEAVRRTYKQARMAEDREDKARARDLVPREQ